MRDFLFGAALALIIGLGVASVVTIHKKVGLLTTIQKQKAEIEGLKDEILTVACTDTWGGKEQ